MRFLSVVVVAVAGLLAGQVRGQFHDGFGLRDGLMPRSWPLAVAKPPLLGKRDGSCATGSHPCSDVNSTSCCSNTQYCIINTNWEVQCCAIGSVCGNPCDAEHYLANETVTTTITSSASTSAGVTALITTTSIEVVCSGRSCSSSFYGCPSSLGGGCCGYGQNCATDTAGSGICIGTSSAATTTTSSSSSSTSSSALPTGAVIEHKSPGLSTGAKAGIAVGVIVVAALVIGALTYFCLRRRRNSARSSGTTTTAATAQELPSMTPAAGRGGAAAAAGASTNRAPQMSEADGDGLSYGYAPSSTGLSRGGNAPAAQGDYFGEMMMTTTTGPPQAEHEQSRDQPRYHQSGHPHDPDSVVAPVEIGTRASLRGRPTAAAAAGAHMRMDSQGSEGYDGSQSELADTSSQRGPSPAFGGPSAVGGGGGGGGPASPVESIAGRFELYGDFGHVTATTTRSGQQEEFHDAQESVGGGDRSRGMVGAGGGGGAGSGAVLPQPFPTPGSEMSEFATPSPMSREEEAQFRREI